MDQNIITICIFRMFWNILFKSVQFTNDIVHAVNYVLFNKLILSQLRNVASFVHSLQEEKKKKKKKKKDPFIHTYYKEQKRKLFIHSFILYLS